MNIKALVMNKQIMLALGMIVFVGAVAAAGTGAFFSSQASATGNVFSAGTLDLALTRIQAGGNPETTKDAQWDFDNMAPGGAYATSSIWLRNTGSIDGESLALTVTGFTANPSNIAKQMRIAEMTFDGSNLLEGGAGATIPEYEEPTACDTTVTPGGLVAAVTGAGAGETICVDSGTYNPGTLTISASGVTLVALNAPDSGDKATINGEIVVSADDVTVKGFEITSSTGDNGVQATDVSGLTITHNHIHDIATANASGYAQGIYLHGNAASMTDIEFSYNRIEDIGNTSLPNSAKGIYIGDTGATGVIDGVSIMHNIIDGVAASDASSYGAGGRGGYGITSNHGGNVKDMSVTNNTISNLTGLWATAIGLEGDTEDAEVLLNVIGSLAAVGAGADTGVNFEDNSFSSTVSVNQNNFDANINGVIINPNFGSFTGTIDATDNWWGDFDPSDQIYENNGTIDTSSFAGGPFAGLINGNDQNSNGYADLHDLRNETISDITPGLDSYDGTNDKEFYMAVQLDGPTTGNSYQGLALEGMEIEFTLNQI